MLNLSLFKSDPEDIQLEKDRVNIEAYEQNLKDRINIEAFEQNLEMRKRSRQTDLLIHLSSQLLHAVRFSRQRNLELVRLVKSMVETIVKHQEYRSEMASAIVRHQKYRSEMVSAIAKQLKQITYLQN